MYIYNGQKHMMSSASDKLQSKTSSNTLLRGTTTPRVRAMKRQLLTLMRPLGSG